MRYKIDQSLLECHKSTNFQILLLNVKKDLIYFQAENYVHRIGNSVYHR